jgi:hypothetical protein
MWGGLNGSAKHPVVDSSNEVCLCCLGCRVSHSPSRRFLFFGVATEQASQIVPWAGFWVGISQSSVGSSDGPEGGTDRAPQSPTHIELRGARRDLSRIVRLALHSHHCEIAAPCALDDQPGGKTQWRSIPLPSFSGGRCTAAWKSASRPKECLLRRSPKLAQLVASKLCINWSPGRYPPGCVRPIPTIRSCTCHTRPSTEHCSCRRAEP